MRKIVVRGQADNLNLFCVQSKVCGGRTGKTGIRGPDVNPKRHGPKREIPLVTLMQSY